MPRQNSPRPGRDRSLRRPVAATTAEKPRTASPEDESFDDYMQRMGEAPPKRSQPRTLLDDAARAVHRYREQCRRSLRDGVSFDDLDALVNRLPETRRMRWVNPEETEQVKAQQRAYFKAVDRADVWLALATGAAAERGRESEWPHDAAEALDGVADAVRRLLAVYARHPSFRLDSSALVCQGFGVLRNVLEKRQFPNRDALGLFALITPEDLARAYEKLRTFRSTRRGRPRAEWRRDTIAELRATGVSRADAEELADTAGLTGHAPPRSPQLRRGLAARYKQRARTRLRRREKTP